MTKEESEIIEYIITAFQGYALGDIKHNQTKPVAAAILCACLLDSMSRSFFDVKNDTDRVALFVSKYLPQYKHLPLFKIFKNPLVHNYSFGKKYSITSDLIPALYGLPTKNGGTFSIPTFIDHLEVAINNAVSDLRTDRKIQNIAIKNAKRDGNMVLIGRQVEEWLFDDSEKEEVWNYYRSLILTHAQFINCQYEIDVEYETASPGNVRILVLVGKSHPKLMVQKVNLNELVRILSLLPIKEYLLSRGKVPIMHGEKGR